MLQRKQKKVLGHRLRLHGVKSLPEPCAREKVKEHQVPGARAKHTELCPEMPSWRRKREEIPATNPKVQGWKARRRSEHSSWATTKLGSLLFLSCTMCVLKRSKAFTSRRQSSFLYHKEESLHPGSPSEGLCGYAGFHVPPSSLQPCCE